MFMYFLMQAPIIRIEDYIIEWGQARGIKGNRKPCRCTRMRHIVLILYSYPEGLWLSLDSLLDLILDALGCEIS
jgi:hypothetical protein